MLELLGDHQVNSCWAPVVEASQKLGFRDNQDLVWCQAGEYTGAITIHMTIKSRSHCLNSFQVCLVDIYKSSIAVVIVRKVVFQTNCSRCLDGVAIDPTIDY